ncbi:MAG TPA: DUF1292 domain-containing protein [Limnochordia bacterium]|nr:DUF1292 domain-containing protein [Limnochordia bacterium]
MGAKRRNIELIDEDGALQRFSIVRVIEVDNLRYAVLQPEGSPRGEAHIFRIENPDAGLEHARLISVDDEYEFDRVAAALKDPDEDE